MTDYNFDFEQRRLDSSERTDSDGGGTSFVFYDGSPNGRKKGGHPFEEEQKKKPVDFGEPVELNLSDKALGVDEEADDETPDGEAAAPSPHIGAHINIEV